MKKEQFEKLLKDLYSLYYPQKLEDKSEFDNLIRKYQGGLENVAIQILLLKYNIDGNKGYNANINKDTLEDITANLIKLYSSGDQIDKNEWSTIKVQVNSETEELKKQLEEQKTSVESAIEKKEVELKSEIESAKKEIQEFFEEKMNLFLQKSNSIEQKISSIKVGGILDHVHIRLTLMNFKVSDISQFPHDEVFACAGLNERFILSGVNGMPIGVVVQDITYDFITGDKLIKELTLNRI